MSFAGFTRAALLELRRLPSIDAAAYATRRTLLHDGLIQPARALIAEVADALRVPLTTGRAAVSPLHADLRFAPAGAPRYKDHLLLTAWHGTDEKVGPTLWIRIDSRSVGFASGVALTPAGRQRWRQAVGGSAGERLASSLKLLQSRHVQRDLDIAGECLQKVPPPWPTDHPRAELLRKTGFFQVRFRLVLPRHVSEPAFMPWCVEHLTELLPMHGWLVRHILADEER